MSNCESEDPHVSLPVLTMSGKQLMLQHHGSEPCLRVEYCETSPRSREGLQMYLALLQS